MGIENATGTDGVQYWFNGSGTGSVITQFSAILFHPRVLGDTVNTDISPNSVNAGTSLQSFTYRFYDIDLSDDSTGFGKIDSVLIGNPFGNNVTVTRVQINDQTIPIQNSQIAPTEQGFATWYYDSGIDSLIIMTHYFDVEDSLIVEFAENIPSQLSSGNDFASRYDARLDSTAIQDAIARSKARRSKDIDSGIVSVSL